MTGLSIVAWPLEDGAPKKDRRPGTDTVQDIRPDSVLTRKYEDRQRKPDDLEAQESQRPIAVHALENLGASDTGITMLRHHLLREQIKRVEDGLDPMNVKRDARPNQKIPTNAWNTIRRRPRHPYFKRARRKGVREAASCTAGLRYWLENGASDLEDVHKIPGDDRSCLLLPQRPFCRYRPGGTPVATSRGKPRTAYRPGWASPIDG